MSFRDYAQGAYRMRGISTGQRINVLIVPEVEVCITRELKTITPTPTLADIKKRSRNSVIAEMLEKVACWLVLNTLDSESKQFNMLVQQDLANVYR